MRKRERELRALAKQYGGSLSVVKSGHVRIEGDGWAVTCPNTPSDARSRMNLLSDLKRATARL